MMYAGKIPNFNRRVSRSMLRLWRWLARSWRKSGMAGSLLALAVLLDT